MTIGVVACADNSETDDADTATTATTEVSEAAEALLTESSHVNAVIEVLDQHGIDDPAAANDLGTFTNPQIQDLYDQLIADGSTSLIDALEVGALDRGTRYRRSSSRGRGHRCGRHHDPLRESGEVGNALGHTPSGGAVTVRAGRDDAMAWIDVTDTGSGISIGELEHIFDRFYRGPSTGTATGRPARAGRGIGLTIARSLARAHDGDVTASSEGPGTGATFRLTIPAA